MQDQDWKEFLTKAKKDYYMILPINCPVFDELVYFNKHGWNHILRKFGAPRLKGERLRRINLLKLAPKIISTSIQINTYRENTINGYSAYFWTLRQVINNIGIRVVIRQLQGGNKHFFSIMDEQEKIPD